MQPLSQPGTDTVAALARPIISAVGRELQEIRERFEAADRNLLIAGTRGDATGQATAEWARLEALGDHHAAAVQLADLCLCLLRYAAEYRPAALRLYLRELLADDIADIALAVTQEARR